MEPEGIIGLLQACVILAVMASSAICDWRTRRVPDTHWLILCVIGVPLAATGIGGDPLAGAFYAAGGLLLSWYMLSRNLVGLTAAPVVAAGFALMALPTLTAGITDGIVSATMFAMCVLLHGCGLLTGGADAKCAMTLALVLPTFPETPVIPLIWHGSMLPPVLPVLLLALAISLVGMLWIPIRNLRAGYIGRGMLTTLEMDVGSMDPDFHWPVQRPVGGELVGCRGSPGTAEGIICELRSQGVSKVRATPSVPFIVPMFLALTLALALGDPVGALSRGRIRSWSTWSRPAPMRRPRTRTCVSRACRTWGSTCPPAPPLLCCRRRRS